MQRTRHVRRWQSPFGYLMLVLGLALGDWSPVLLFVLVLVGHECLGNWRMRCQQGAAVDGRSE